jgi:hypothetical protein
VALVGALLGGVLADVVSPAHVLVGSGVGFVVAYVVVTLSWSRLGGRGGLRGTASARHEAQPRAPPEGRRGAAGLGRKVSGPATGGRLARFRSGSESGRGAAPTDTGGAAARGRSERSTWRAWPAARWVLVAVIGVGLGIPSIVAGFVSPLPAVAAFVMFVLWGAFDILEANGWPKRVVATAVALIWAVDLSIDLGLMLAVAGFGVWVEGAFVLADLAMLIGTWPAVWKAWGGSDALDVPGEWVQRWVGFPAVIAATGMHTVELVMAASWAAVPMGVAAVALAVLMVIKHLEVRREGAGERVKRIAVYVGGTALIGYGLLRAVLENLWLLAGVTAGVTPVLTVLLAVLHRRGRPSGRERPRGAADGAVAVGTPLDDTQRARTSAALRRHHDRLVPLDEVTGSLPVALPVPTGVRVLIVGDDVSVPNADQLMAFPWTDPEVASAVDGVLVVPWMRLVEIAEHMAAGRLPAGWWDRLVNDEHATGLGAELVAARAMQDRVLSRDLRSLRWGRIADLAGAQMWILAVPLLAMSVLGASALQLAMLTALSSGTSLVLMLPAGLLVERSRKRPLMIGVGLFVAVTTASIPVAAVFGWLTLTHLYVVVGLRAVVGLLYPIAARPYAESLARGDRTRLRKQEVEMTSELYVVRMIGTGVGGMLVAVVGAAGAVLVDAVSYLVNAAMLTRIKTPDVPIWRSRAPPSSVRGRMHGLLEGLRWTLAHPVLGLITRVTATRNFFWTMRVAVLTVFLVSALEAAPWVVGAVLAVSAAGGLIGAQLAGRLSERVGAARLFWVMAVWAGPVYLLLPFAQPGWGVALAAVSLFGSTATVAASAVVVRPYRSKVTPGGLRTRTYAAERWLSAAGTAAGAVVGGLAVTWFGFVPTLLAAGVGAWAAALWLVRTPLWHARNFEDATGTGGDGGLLATGLGPEFERQVHGTLVRQERRLRVARWAAGLLRIRGPPLAVDADERLWVVPRARLARWLRRDGMDRHFADLVAGRVWAAGVRDGRGRRVFVVVAERVPAVRASGLWPAVRDHENRHLDKKKWEAEEHGPASAALIAEIEAGVRTAGLAAAGEVPGWRARWLPLSWRGGVQLRRVFDPVREASRAVERARSRVLDVRRAMHATDRAGRARNRLQRWWVSRRIPAEVRGQNLSELVEERGQALLLTQQVEQRATSKAMAEAVLAGFGRRDVLQAREAAVQGWKRHMASLAALPGALPGQAAGAQMASSLDFADHYDRSASWVTTQGSIGTSTTAGIGLAMAGLGDRLIKNMVATVVLGAIGSAGLALVGLVDSAVLFLPSLIAIGVMGLAAGLVRGRMAVYHPLPPEQKDVRDSQYESSFTIAQLLLPLLIVNGIAAVGIPVTMLVLSGLAIGLTVVVWAAVRGERRGLQPRAPPQEERAPSVLASMYGAVWQVVGTPRGLARLVVSIPVLTVLSGMPPFVLGGAIADQMVLLNDPTSAVGTTAQVVSAVLLVSRLAALAVRKAWPWIKQLLGGRSSEARVIRVGTALALVQLLPALWLFLSPGLWPFLVTQVVSAAATAWMQAGLHRWMEGGTGASLINVGKAGSVAAGAGAGIPVLGGFATAVVGLAVAGAPYSHLVDAAHGRMLLLAVPTLVASALVGSAISRLRIGTADELEAALIRVGATPAEADLVKRTVARHGVRDVGSAAALYLSGAWQPCFARVLRLRARAARLESIGLESIGSDGRDLVGLLRAALVELVGSDRAGAVPPGHDGAVDERRSGPVRWALDVTRAVRSAIRRAVVDLRNRGPPGPGPTTGGVVS